MNQEIKDYMELLAEEIYRRYQLSSAVITPDSVLLAIANAIHDVNEQDEKP